MNFVRIDDLFVDEGSFCRALGPSSSMNVVTWTSPMIQNLIACKLDLSTPSPSTSAPGCTRLNLEANYARIALKRSLASVHIDMGLDQISYASCERYLTPSMFSRWHGVDEHKLIGDNLPICLETARLFTCKTVHKPSNEGIRCPHSIQIEYHPSNTLCCTLDACMTAI